MDLLAWAHGKHIDRVTKSGGIRFERPKRRQEIIKDEFVPTVAYRQMKGETILDGRKTVDGKTYPTPDHPQWANLPLATQERILAKIG